MTWYPWLVDWTDEEIYEKKVQAIAVVDELLHMLEEANVADNTPCYLDLSRALHSLEVDTGKTAWEHREDAI